MIYLYVAAYEQYPSQLNPWKQEEILLMSDLKGDPMKLVANWVVFYECKTFSAHPYHLDEAPNLANTHYFIMFRWLSKNQCEVEIRESAEKHVLETTYHSSFEQFQKYVKESSNRYRGQTLCRK